MARTKKSTPGRGKKRNAYQRFDGIRNEHGEITENTNKGAYVEERACVYMVVL